MIELNESYTSSLRDLGGGTNMRSTSRDYDGLTLDSNMLFNRFLSVNTSGPTVEIPAIAKDNVVGTIINNETIERVVIPLYVTGERYVSTIKTGAAIIKRSIGVSYAQRLRKIKDGKDRIYYIGNGLILDEDYTPLFMASFIYGKPYDNFRPINILFRMSPEFYLDTTNVVNKELLRKVIPWYMENCTGFDIFNRRRSKRESYNVSLLIEDFNYMFSSPDSPDASVTNESLNTLLLNNSNTIINQLMATK